MADEVKEALEDDEIIVVMTDDEGNEYYYRQEMILPVNGENFALLVPTASDEEVEQNHEHGDGCGCGCEDEDEAFFAKIVPGEDGEDEYIEPTDEEFDAVCAAYDALVDEEDKD